MAAPPLLRPNPQQYSPFVFNRLPRSSSSYHPDHHFAINGFGEQHLRHQPNYYLAEIPPPTPNLRIGMWGRGDAKAYFRFHGGIGDGYGGVACRNTEVNTAARPLQLFEALIAMDTGAIAGSHSQCMDMSGMDVDTSRPFAVVDETTEGSPPAEDSLQPVKHR